MTTTINDEIIAKLINYMAWRMSPVNKEEIVSFLRYNNISTKSQLENIIKELSSKGLIILQTSDIFYQKEYILPYTKYWDILWEIKKNNFSEFYKISDKIYNRLYSNNNIKALRGHLLEWAITGYDPTERLIIPSGSSFFIALFQKLLLHSKWAPILPVFIDDDIILIANSYIDSAELGMDFEAMEEHKKIFLENPYLDYTVKAILRSDCIFFSHVLTGNIKDIPNIALTERTSGLFAMALYHQYNKDYSKAVNFYKKAIKLENYSEYPYNTFYAITYILALFNDKRAMSQSKLFKLFNLHTTLVSSHIPIFLLMSVLLDKNTTEILHTFEINKIASRQLTRVACELIIHHYQLANLGSEWQNKMTAFLVDHKLKLLQLEFSSELSTLKDKQTSLIEEIGASPLFVKHYILENWQKTINTLNDTILIKCATPKSIVTNSRVFYLVDSSGNFTPRLQKTKDGITWTKGRNIALSTFRSLTAEGMSNLDKQVASYVKCYSSWNGGDVYELNGNKVFATLIGHPLVFQERNPDIPVQIIKDNVQLIVESNTDGYYISTNAQKTDNSRTVVVRENDTLYRVFELTAIQRDIIKAFSQNSIFPLSAKEQLTELLAKIAPSITVHSDLVKKVDNFKSIASSSKITIQLQPMSNGVKVELFVKPLEDHPPYCKAGQGTASIIGLKGGEQVMATRKLKKEIDNYHIINEILKKVGKDEDIEDVAFFDDYYECLELIEQVQSLDKIARVEWPEGAKLKIKGIADFDKIKISMKGRASWFEVEGELYVDKNLQLSIAELLEKNRNSKGRFIALNESDYIALSKELRSKLNELDSRIIKDKKKLQLSSFSTSIVSDLESRGVAIKKDKKFAELQERIETSDKLAITVPTSLQAELRDYQLDGFQWMSKLASWGAGACLADDMGLGKTVQSIALMLSRAKQGPTLIVAPASVVPNWQNELLRFAPSLNCKVLHDNTSQRKEIVSEAAEYDVVLTTYGLLNYESELLCSREWNIILLDEAHTIKNKETKMSKAAMMLQGDFRLLLTGTPIQNHLGEIWNLFQFAMPGLLGPFEHFNNRFIQPIEKDHDKSRQLQLKKMLQPFLLRRTKSEVLDELPTKTEIVYDVQLSDAERAFYENIRQMAILNMEDGTLNPLQTLAEITKLRQAACHPALIDNSLDIPSSKVEVLLNLTESLIANNHRALVFSQFTSFLKLVRKELDSKGIKYLYLDGSVSIRDREKLVKDFQQGEIPLFLISLKAGGTGLNLTAADYVIHLDPWWNPAVEDQASDRAHRIGQTRPVTIYRLIAKQTIEEKIIQLHKSKKSLADSLLEGSNMAHKLTKSEMLGLLKDEF